MSWLPGGPLTDFRRGRRNLPLPQERVKIRPAFEVEAAFCKGLQGEGLRRARFRDACRSHASAGT